jgi:hypothetical protein
VDTTNTTNRIYLLSSLLQSTHTEVDGKKIKTDVWYQLKNEKFIEG